MKGLFWDDKIFNILITVLDTQANPCVKLHKTEHLKRVNFTVCLSKLWFKINLKKQAQVIYIKGKRKVKSTD